MRSGKRREVYFILIILYFLLALIYLSEQFLLILEKVQVSSKNLISNHPTVSIATYKLIFQQVHLGILEVLRELKFRCCQ